MAVSLLSYTGNAGLGFGGDASIPATVSNPNMDVINNAIRDVMLLDNQKNIQLFQQKIRDRDSLTEMIMNNEVSSGDILPEYRTHFDEAEKRATQAFEKWGGNFNDKEGYRKYQSAITDLKDIATHAQAKTLSMRQLEKEKSAQVLPRKQAEYQQWIDRQKAEPFWNPVVPYQQLHDFAIDDILSGVKEFKTSVTDFNDPTGSYDLTYVDFNDILRNKRNQYVNDQDAADSIDQFFDKIQRLAPQQLVPALDAIDAQIDKYNTDRGFAPGQRGFVPKVNRASINGQTLIQEPKAEFAAKYALANQANFATKTPRFDKDIAKYGLDKERLKIMAKKAGIDAAKAGAYIRNLDAKTRKYLEDEQSAGTNVAQQYEDFINTMKPRGINFTQYKPYPLDKKGKPITTGRPVVDRVERVDAIFMDELPAGYQFINGPVIALDSKGNATGKITVGRLEPFETTKGQKRPYYIPKYVNGITGDEINVNRLPPELEEGYRLTREIRNISKDDYIKGLLKSGALELVLKGKNGAANYTSLYQSAKALNALGTTKGEENVMNPPENIPEEPLE